MRSRLLLVLMSAVVVVLVAELVARVVYDPPTIMKVYDPFAYMITQPDVRKEFQGLDGQVVTLEINELGMRGPSLAASQGAELTLVFLGGSTTENPAVPLESSFPHQVGEALGRSLQRSVRVFNGGASAATAAVTLGRLQHQVLALEPSLVVVMHGINDLLGGFHPRYRADSRHLPRPATADDRPISYFRSWVLGRLRLEASIPVASARQRLRRPTDFPSLPAYRRNLRSLSAIAEAHEIPLLLLTQPTMYELEEERQRFHLMNRLAYDGLPLPDVPSLRLGMEIFNREVLALEGESGAHVFDLSSRVPRSWELFYDECHFTAAGNEWIARALGPEVERILGSS